MDPPIFTLAPSHAQLPLQRPLPKGTVGGEHRFDDVAGVPDANGAAHALVVVPELRRGNDASEPSVFFFIKKKS